jgi:hypothetical protein
MALSDGTAVRYWIETNAEVNKASGSVPAH